MSNRWTRIENVYCFFVKLLYMISCLDVNIFLFFFRNIPLFSPSADTFKFLDIPAPFFRNSLDFAAAIGYNNDWLKRLVDNLPTAFDLFRPGTGVSCSNTMEEASNMKKLLTIMLAVLLAALAVAASAEDNVKNADVIIVGAGGAVCPRPSRR